MADQDFYMHSPVQTRIRPDPPWRSFIDFTLPFKDTAMICLEKDEWGKFAAAVAAGTSGKSWQRFQTGNDLIDMTFDGSDIVFAVTDRARNRCVAIMDLAEFQSKMAASSESDQEFNMRTPARTRITADGSRTFIDFELLYKNSAMICLKQDEWEKFAAAAAEGDTGKVWKHFESGNDRITMAFRGSDIILSSSDRAGNKCAAVMNLVEFQAKVAAVSDPEPEQEDSK